MTARESEPLRLVLADDEPLVLQGLKVVLDAQPDLEVVGCAADGAAAVELVRRLRPEVALIDLGMPALHGIEVVYRITAEALGTRTLVLTTFSSDDQVERALAAGADGYVLKRSTPAELVHAIRLVARGGTLAVPQAFRGRLSADRGPGDHSPHATALARLTERERQVLTLLARGRTNQEIAAELVLGRETVKTHMSTLLAKLGARDRTQAVVIAYESGFA